MQSLRERAALPFVQAPHDRRREAFHGWLQLDHTLAPAGFDGCGMGGKFSCIDALKQICFLVALQAGEDVGRLILPMISCLY